MGCEKAQEFLEQKEITVASRADASKDRRQRDQAIALARSVDKIVVGKGKKVTTIDIRGASPSDDELAMLLLGRTGNLRAPTLRKGRTLLVGFSEAAYKQMFGE
jgi:arsenate reductase-like glutaredoxin family protein